MPGKVIVQSYNPEAYSIQCAKRQNYDMFYETEIELRRQLKYPPFCDIIVIGFNSSSENDIKKISFEMYEKLKSKLNTEFKVFQPMPSPIDKIQNRYRWRIIIKGNMNVEANIVLNEVLQEMYQKDLKTTRIAIDVNPNNMA